MRTTKTSKYVELLNFYKSNLTKAEDDYTKALEEFIKYEIYKVNRMAPQDYQRFMGQKYYLVDEYINGIEMWGIKENFLKEHHYLEKFVELKTGSIEHYSDFQGVEDHEIEILKGIQSMEIQEPFFYGDSQEEFIK